MAKYKKYTKEWLEQLCKESYSYAEVLRKAGRKQGGGTQETLKKWIQFYQIDISHFKGQSWSKGLTLEIDNRIKTTERYDIKDIFVENSIYSRAVAKSYIIRHNLLPYKCAICGNDGHWLNNILKLQLDHINGINNDHRIENLRFLCPNCHSQTITFAGKNNKAEITNEEIINAIDEIGSLSPVDICSYLGRSHNGINIEKINKVVSMMQLEDMQSSKD